MKRLLLSLTFAVAFGQSGHSQTSDSTSDPGYSTAAKRQVAPAQRAAHQLTMLQKKLNLNQEQVIKLRMILLRQNASLDSLRNSPSGDKKADNKTRRAINQDADLATYGLLTTDQQALFTQWKKEQQEKRKLSRQAHKGGDPTGVSPASAPGN